jgi:hypothetical protein
MYTLVEKEDGFDFAIYYRTPCDLNVKICTIEIACEQRGDDYIHNPIVTFCQPSVSMKTLQAVNLLVTEAYDKKIATT